MSEEKKSGITPAKLMEYILTQMTAEQALLKLLQGSLIEYEKLKFDSPEKSIHPVVVMSMAAMELGWDFVIDKTDPDINGMAVGTTAWLEKMGIIKKKETNGEGTDNTNSGTVQSEV